MAAVYNYFLVPQLVSETGSLILCYSVYANQPDLDQRNHVEKEKENQEVRNKNELGNDEGLDHNRKYAQQGDSLSDQHEQGNIILVLLMLLDRCKYHLNCMIYEYIIRSLGGIAAECPGSRK